MLVWYLVHQYAFVSMLVTGFTVTFCAHIISFDGNLVSALFTHYCHKRGGANLATCPFVWIGMWSFASSVNMHLIFFKSYFCA